MSKITNHSWTKKLQKDKSVASVTKDFNTSNSIVASKGL